MSQRNNYYQKIFYRTDSFAKLMHDPIRIATQRSFSLRIYEHKDRMKQEVKLVVIEHNGNEFIFSRDNTASEE